MRLLVIRTSAMGDVALTVPLLREMRESFPDTEMVFVTRAEFSPFFSSVEGLKFFFPDFRKHHKGFTGLLRLYSDLNKQGRFDYVIDLHDVLRSQILRFLFRISGVRVKKIDKGRREKRLLIKGKGKLRLKHTVERYADVFARAGFNVSLSKGPWMIPSHHALDNALRISEITCGINIGVAPYAKHELKMWPEEFMIALLRMISSKVNAKFWFFGGKEESEKLIDLQKKVPGSVYPGEMLDLEDELALMTRLTFMISMDSSNMHMAALAGLKVVSIWGATDPLAGFGAWMQPEEYSVRISVDQLTCRPCTVYGAGKCWRGDHACMEWLKPEMVFKKLEEFRLW
ncbi:MAG: glycosyltransferase family 9 protein [Bacteroidota bacterium]|nr:glycosyltransferase family 9 protein [Bacteroidota bacterium]